MDCAVHDRIIALCTLAAVEQDSKKLLVLIEEINRLFDEREQQLKATRLRSPAIREGAQTPP